MRPRSITLRLYYFTAFVSFGLYNPFFPRWLEARGIEGARMGLVAAAVPAMGVVGPPIFGLVADSFGLRGHLLRVACAGAAAGMALIALGHALGFGAILAAVLVFGIFRSPMITMADVVALEEASGAGYARIRLWGSIGFLAAAIAGGRAIDPARPVALPLVIAAALFAAFVAASGLPKRSAIPPVPALDEARALLAAPDFRLFLAISFAAQAAHSNHDLCLSLHLRDLGASSSVAGLAWALGVLAEVALMAGSAPLFRRFAPPTLIAFALAGSAARWVLLATVTSIPVLLAVQPLHAVSFGLWWIASLAYTRGRVPPGALATGQGLFMASTAAGSVLGMPLWGALYRRAGGGATFGAAAGLAAAALILAVLWARRPSPIPEA